MAGALEGVKILEFSEIIAAPFGCMQLADMGAEVIKVEPPGGDPWRANGQFAPGENRAFLALNRGKRGIIIDLKTPQGREIVYKLVPQMDVVVVNYRPDTPPDLGIDYATLRALNERLIYVQLTAFGPKGPYAHRPGYDIVAQAVTGLMATDGKTTDENLPAPTSPPVADFASGMTMVGAVCAALYTRERTGKGQKVELSLMATALAMQGGQVMTIEATQKAAEAAEPSAARTRRAGIRELRAQGTSWIEIREQTADTRVARGNIYYRCYYTQDGEIIAVACLNNNLRRKFRAALGVDEPAPPDPKRTPEEARAQALELMGVCEARMREHTLNEWLDIFDQHGVPAAPFHMAYELLDHPQVRSNNLIVELDHPAAGHVQMVGPLFSMSENSWNIGRPPPTLGQHTDEVLRELGYSDEDIAALRNKSVVH